MPGGMPGRKLRASRYTVRQDVQRKDPTLSEKLAALILQHFKIPHEHAKKMTTADILSLVQTDHEVHVKVAIANGERPETYNHPARLTIRLYKDHRIKTHTKDIPALAKSDQVQDAYVEYRKAILKKTEIVEDTAPERPRSKLKGRPFASGAKRKIQSRPFPTKRGTS